MRVADWMTPDPVTIAPAATAGEALALMRQRRIRHLPVVDGGRLVGMLSDRDVRSALPSAAVLGEIEEDDPATSRPVADIMTADPLTIPPSQPVEEAARLLTEQRIGVVPVVDGSRLLGILSADDLLRAFVESSGVLLPSSRLELLLPDRPGALAGALAVVAARQVNVVSVAMAPAREQRDAGRRRVIVRCATINPGPLAAALRAEGYDVVPPLDLADAGGR
jgi:acetoin utilization protein AcuB